MLSIEFITRFFYRLLPLPAKHKIFIKNLLYNHLGLIFSGSRAYERFKALKQWYPKDFVFNQHHEINDSNYTLYLPSELSVQTMNNCIVDVIIPVYKGYIETKKCIESVLQSVNETRSRIIVINDASPDPDLVRYLKSLQKDSILLVINNSVNLGFTSTVNIGISLSSDNDVVLLNSDTEVANNWLDKLVNHAYSAENIATVTPFSNNATICNYPNLGGFINFSSDENTAYYDYAFGLANKSRHIDIPTGVGFCMFIRRSCLNTVGQFDAEAFGKGYGEENDFCMRAIKHGLRNLLAADTFVYHEGEVSFGSESKDKKLNASKIIRRRYPHYEKDVTNHIKSNKIRSFIVAATAARYKFSGKPVVLHVTHSYGGGTEKHIQTLAKIQHEKSKVLILRPFSTGFLITSADQADDLYLTFDVSQEGFLSDFLTSFGVTVIHFHSLLGFAESCKRSLRKLTFPFHVTLHDYAPICPKINLVSNNGLYCGEPSPVICNKCLSHNSHIDVKDVIWWRESHRWLFDKAQTVICPSKDVFKRFLKYFPNANYKVIPHEKVLFAPIVLPKLSNNEPLRVAILGVLAQHKGLSLIRNTLGLIENSIELKANFNFRLLGYVDGGPIDVSSEVFSQTGHYKDEDLLSLVNDYNPHVILFASVCPETYSFTLSTALKSGRPLITTDIGSFPERTKDLDWVWHLPFDITSEELVNFLKKIRSKNFLNANYSVNQKRFKGVKQLQTRNHKFYEQEYFLLKENKSDYFDLRVPGKTLAIVVLEMVEDYPSPCAYIRLLLPLLSLRSEKFDFRVVSSEAVTSYISDLFITHRVAIQDINQINLINNHCIKHDIKIIYDLDDYLLFLPSEHPESEHYASKSASVFRWINSSNKICTSTTSLKNKLLKLNSEVTLIENTIYSDFMNPIDSKIKKENNAFNVLYMGTTTHATDLDLIRPALEKLKKDFPSIEIYLIGITQRPLDLNYINHIEIPIYALRGYPSFIQWLKSLDIKFDVGLAPLVDNIFNSCKSDIKFLDYSLLGAVTIASNCQAYESISHLVNGMKVENTENDWYEAVKFLYFNPLKLKKIRKAAIDHLTERNSTHNRQSILEEVYLKSNSRKAQIVNAQNLEGINRDLVACGYLNGTGIEIGALHNPLPIPPGVVIKYVDRFDKVGLYLQYPELKKFKLVDVDIVDDGEELLSIPDESQDFVIANHFLEHCEDPIKTIKTFLRVLKQSGILYLALPDKRYSFDKNRKRTTLQHLINDHVLGPNLSRWDHYKEWPKFVEPHFGREYKEEEIELRAHELMDSSYSIHFHVWEPQDVLELINYLSNKLLLPLSLECFLELKDEMILIVKKTRKGTVSPNTKDYIIDNIDMHYCDP